MVWFFVSSSREEIITSVSFPSQTFHENDCIFKATSMFCLADLCRLQAAAHIHKYLNLDEDKLKEITSDSQEGGFFF